MRDEVLAEWRINQESPFLYVYVYIDGQFDPMVSAMRNEVFRRELPLAIEAIRYGDRNFFEFHSDLDNASIWINFDSANPEYKRFEYWGILYDYK